MFFSGHRKNKTDQSEDVWFLPACLPSLKRNGNGRHFIVALRIRWKNLAEITGHWGWNIHCGLDFVQFKLTFLFVCLFLPDKSDKVHVINIVTWLFHAASLAYCVWKQPKEQKGPLPMMLTLLLQLKTSTSHPSNLQLGSLDIKWEIPVKGLSSHGCRPQTMSSSRTTRRP